MDVIVLLCSEHNFPVRFHGHGQLCLIFHIHHGNGQAAGDAHIGGTCAGGGGYRDLIGSVAQGICFFLRLCFCFVLRFCCFAHNRAQGYRACHDLDALDHVTERRILAVEMLGGLVHNEEL